MITIKEMSATRMGTENLDMTLTPVVILGLVTWISAAITITVSSWIRPGDLSATVLAGVGVGLALGWVASFPVHWWAERLRRSHRKFTIMNTPGFSSPIVVPIELLCLVTGLIPAAGAVLSAGLFLVLNRNVVRLARSRRPESTGKPAGKGGSIPRVYRSMIAIACTAMTSEAQQRWRDSIDEALHDFAPEQHGELLRNFLLHAPMVIMRSWTTSLSRRSL